MVKTINNIGSISQIQLKMVVYLMGIVFTTFLWSCSEEDNPAPTTTDSVNPVEPSLVNENATPETEALYQRLIDIRDAGVAFGHQDGTAYGINWTHSGFPSDSDVKRVTGDYPAVLGFDIGDIENGASQNLDGLSFDLMKDLIREGHKEGSIITISWHADNPITGGSFVDRSEPAIRSVLPDGERHEKFKEMIETVADFFLDLKDDNGNLIPIIFRPWHEMNHSAFWWSVLLEGQDSEDYKALFRLTYQMLTDTHEVNSLIYCYSPDKLTIKSEYLENYPGDIWVDVLGIDVYDWQDERFINEITTGLGIMRSIANESNKLFALTETGLDKVTEADWWTKKLLKGIENSGAVYALVWRNQNTGHFFGPYEDHDSKGDFNIFVQSEGILLRDDLP